MPIFRGQEFVTSISDRKESVRLASTGNINLSSTSITTMDGVPLVNNNRVLLANQTTATQNGIYTWNSSTKQFTRARDADSNIEVTPGLRVFVEEGETNSGSDFVLANIGSITLGVTNLVFTKTSAIVTLTNDGQFGASNRNAVITVNKNGQVTAVSDTPTYITNANLEFDSVTINGADIQLGAEATFDTDDFAEGVTNLYYTDTRARAAISVSGDLTYNSTTGVISYTTPTLTTTLADLTDVTLTSPVSGEALVYNGTGWVNTTVSTVAALADLTDVNTSKVSDGYILTYDATASEWISAQGIADGTIIDGGGLDGPTAGSGVTYISDIHNISDLNDVAVTSPTVNQVLKWNGSAWVNGTDAAGTSINSTDDLTEGSSNLYYTDTRVRYAIGVSGDLNYNSSTGVISYTAPVLSNVATTGSYNDLTDKPAAGVSIGRAIAMAIIFGG